MVPLNIQEAYYFSLFFDSVAEAVSSRMGDRSRVGEEQLTFLLCEMMDDSYSSRHVLKYSLNDLKSDLERIGSLLTIKIDTTAHGKPLENEQSASDLGIVLKYTNEYEEIIEKAVLVQAKRLDKSTEAPKYTYRSSYKEFNPEQITKLKSINDTYGSKSTCYLFYNPPRAAFKESSQHQITESEQIIREMDDSVTILLNGWLRSYLFLSIILPSFTTEPLAASPGLRFSNIQSVEDAINKLGRDKPSLYTMYSNVTDSSNPRALGFSPLSTFFVRGLFFCLFGERNPGLVKLARGEVDDVTSPGNARQMGVAKHTIDIHVRMLSRRRQDEEEE